MCVADHFYVQATDTCMQCEDTGAWFDAFTIMMLLLLLLATAALVYYFQRTMREQRLRSLDELFIAVLLRLRAVDPDIYTTAPFAVNENMLIFNRRLRTLGKTYLTFFQVVSSIPSVLNFDELPEEYRQVFSQVSAVVNLGVSRGALCSCFFGTSFDFIDKLFMDTLYPAALLLLFVAAFHLHIFIKFRRWFPPSTPIASVVTLASLSAEEALASEQRAIVYIRSKYIEVFLFFTYLILPSLAATIFETFGCQHVDPDDVHDGDDLYLRADYSVSCHSSRYYFAYVWAIITIFVYVLGIPAFYGYLLYTSRNLIKARENELDMILYDVSAAGGEGAEPPERNLTEKQQWVFGIRYLFDSYKPCFWYWELVETAYRLGLTGFLVLGAYAGDNGQMVLGLGLAMAFTKLCEYKEPFVESVNQSSKVCLSLSLALSRPCHVSTPLSPCLVCLNVWCCCVLCAVCRW